MLKTISLKSILVAGICCLFLLATLGERAGAATEYRSYVWDNRKSAAVVPMRFAPSYKYSKVKYWMIEGTKFRIKCYTINENYTGNWTSRMWFLGWEQSRGYYGYVHSSHVFNQTSVGRC